MLNLKSLLHETNVALFVYIYQNSMYRYNNISKRYRFRAFVCIPHPLLLGNPHAAAVTLDSEFSHWKSHSINLSRRSSFWPLATWSYMYSPSLRIVRPVAAAAAVPDEDKEQQAVQRTCAEPVLDSRVIVEGSDAA